MRNRIKINRVEPPHGTARILGHCRTAVLKPQQVVIMDNASFHKSARIQALIEKAGCELLFLPPYSSDLNKIEKVWARLKHYLGKTIGAFDNLWDAVDEAFRKLS